MTMRPPFADAKSKEKTMNRLNLNFSKSEIKEVIEEALEFSTFLSILLPEILPAQSRKVYDLDCLAPLEAVQQFALCA
jgi:hypothetical protein